MDRDSPRPWGRVEFRHLDALAAVAGRGSFHTAAHQLGYTQSAVSQQIAVLERAIGYRLIRRAARGRPLALTPAGECVSRLHLTLETAFAAARRDIDDGVAKTAALVRFGCAFSLPRLPAAVSEMSRQHPEVAVEIVRASDEAAVVALLDGDAVDAAAFRSGARLAAGEPVSTVSSPYICVAPPLSRVAEARGPVALRDLGGYPRITTADGTAFSDDARPSVVAADVEMLIEFVAGGLGVGVVPSVLTPRTRRVARRPLRETLVPFELTLASTAAPTPASATFLTSLAALLGRSPTR